MFRNVQAAGAGVLLCYFDSKMAIGHCMRMQRAKKKLLRRLGSICVDSQTGLDAAKKTVCPSGMLQRELTRCNCLAM